MNREWLRAFRPHNASWARKVQEYMRTEFGWDVSYDSDYECIGAIHTNGGTWEEDIDDIECYDNSELLDSIINSTSLNSSRIRKLDEKFNKKVESVGSYTKIPFPKVNKEDNNVKQSI